MFKDVDLQLNLGSRSEDFFFKDVGFHLKSGFKKMFCSQMLILCSQMLVFFLLIMDSQKISVEEKLV